MVSSIDDWFADHATFLEDAPDDELIEAQAPWDVATPSQPSRSCGWVPTAKALDFQSAPLSGTRQEAVVQALLVAGWSKSSYRARWEVDGRWYVMLDWSSLSRVVEKRLGISHPEANRLTRREIAAIKMERQWDSATVSWDVSNDFPDSETMAVSIRASKQPAARKYYLTGEYSNAQEG